MDAPTSSRKRAARERSRTNDPDRTKADILAVATEEFAASGLSGARVDAIAAQFTGAKFDATASESIAQDMWEKWVFIASAAGLTSLMHASIGDIVAAGGQDVALSIFDECCAIAAHNGFAPRAPAVQRGR